MWAEVSTSGSVLAQSGGISVSAHPAAGRYFLTFPASVQAHALQVTPVTQAAGAPVGSADARAVACGGSGGANDPNAQCASVANVPTNLFVATFVNGALADTAFFISAVP
jgi:hypothetical protein